MATQSRYSILYGDGTHGYAGHSFMSLHELFDAVQEALREKRPFEVREERVLLSWQPPAPLASLDDLPY
jgi:hypothetical protein